MSLDSEQRYTLEETLKRLTLGGISARINALTAEVEAPIHEHAPTGQGCNVTIHLDPRPLVAGILRAITGQLIETRHLPTPETFRSAPQHETSPCAPRLRSC